MADDIVLDVFPECPDCGWGGYPRYRTTSGFTVRDSARLGGRFYVMRTRCANCNRHYRMARRVGEPTWQHDLLIEETDAAA